MSNAQKEFNAAKMKERKKQELKTLPEKLSSQKILDQRNLAMTKGQVISSSIHYFAVQKKSTF